MAEKWTSKSKSKGGHDGSVKLHKTKDPSLLKKILKAKGSVPTGNETDSNGELPTHAYVKSNDKRKFECLMTYLIHRECDLNHRNEEGMTALHVACDINDQQSAKALIAFGADINTLTQTEHKTSQTPLDIVHEKHPDRSDIPQILARIGGKHGNLLSADDDDSEDENGLDYEMESSDDYFKMKPVKNDSSVDAQELSARLSAVNDDDNDGGGRDEVDDYHPPDSLDLPSLPEEGDGTPKKMFQTPDASVEMGLTQLSVMMASGRINLLPQVPTEDRPFIRRSPKSISPLSASLTQINEIPEDQDNVEKGEVKTKEDFNGEAVVNGHTEPNECLSSPEEHADVIPAGSVVGPESPSTEKRLVNFGFVGGDLFKELETNTEAALNRGLEDSTGDEGYAAWLQQREILRAKKRNGGFMEYTDTGETKPKNPTPPPQQSPPPKPKRLTEVTQPRGCRRLTQLRNQAPTASVMRSLSTRNREMEVTQSIIGYSVSPINKKVKGANGQSLLCLDGGGIKGLVQIEILSAIERVTGKRITELFDWIVGTSTGGILALGLVYAGLKLEDLRRMYFEMKDSVFRRKSKLLSTVCDTEALEELLKETMGTDKNMSSVRKPNVLITAVDKKDTRLPLVFFNNCFKNEFSKQPVWKVARYTSAAPVFFKECDNFVDGGVVANNPTSHAMAEIQEHFKKQAKPGVAPPEISCVVSVGCGIYPPEPLGNTNITDAIRVKKMLTSPNAAAGTFKDLLTLLTTALTQSEGVAKICKINCEQQGIPYYRFSPEMGEDVGTAETDNIKLCDMIISGKAMLTDCAAHLNDLAENLGHKPVKKRRQN